MPCDLVITCSLNLGVADFERLKKAIEQMGGEVSYCSENSITCEIDGVECRIRGDKIRVPQGEEHLADKIRSAYTLETVREGAEQYGWEVEEDPLDRTQYVLVRGS